MALFFFNRFIVFKTLIYSINLKVRNMIKVVKENRDVHYLNKDMFIQIKYCKESNVLVACPVNPQIPEIKIEGIQSITDNVDEIEKIIKKPTKESYYNDPIEKVLDYVKADRSHYSSVYFGVEKAIKDFEITTVGELLNLGLAEFLKRPGFGKVSAGVVSEALEELYGAKWKLY